MGLPGDLAEIDALLDDERFFEPFRQFFDPTIGRRSDPLEHYIRMMFAKYRYELGFEPLCREVADSPERDLHRRHAAEQSDAAERVARTIFGDGSAHAG